METYWQSSLPAQLMSGIHCPGAGSRFLPEDSNLRQRTWKQKSIDEDKSWLKCLSRKAKREEHLFSIVLPLSARAPLILPRQSAASSSREEKGDASTPKRCAWWWWWWWWKRVGRVEKSDSRNYSFSVRLWRKETAAAAPSTNLVSAAGGWNVSARLRGP